MKESTLVNALIVFSVIFICCNGQFKAQMRLQQVGGQSLEHHDMSAQNIVARNHHKRIFHNHKFIHSRIQKSKKQHKLNLHSHRISQLSEHDKTLQTFNLEPNVYAFNLEMKIGGFDYKMQIDSGSSDIFIKGENAKGEPKVRYQCGQTCINENDHYQLGYLDGQVQTYQKTLPIELGDLKFNESVLVAYKVQKNFKDNQGLVGLSYQALSTNPNPTFLQTLKNQKVIDAYAFGVNLNFQDQDRSFITFGNYDKNFFVDSLDFYPLTSDQFYYIDSEGVSFGTGKLLSIKTALFDTGNTCISIPNKYQNDILSQFNVKGNKCYFDVEQSADMFSLLRCKFTSFEDVPVLKIHIAGRSYEIKKQYYIQACDRKPGSKQNGDPKSGVWYCDTYIQSVRGMSQLFLGDAFFSRFYTYFDLETRQLAIAQNKQIITIERLIENKVDASKRQWKQIIQKLGDDTTYANKNQNSGQNATKPNKNIRS